MMYQSGSRLYLETKEVQVLSLKYVEKAFALNIFLPKKNVGLASFLARTNGKELQKLLKDAQYETINVRPFRSKYEQIRIKISSFKENVWISPCENEFLVLDDISNRSFR